MSKKLSQTQLGMEALTDAMEKAALSGESSEIFSGFTEAPAPAERPEPTASDVFQRLGPMVPKAEEVVHERHVFGNFDLKPVVRTPAPTMTSVFGKEWQSEKEPVVDNVFDASGGVGRTIIRSRTVQEKNEKPRTVIVELRRAPIKLPVRNGRGPNPNQG